MKLIIFLQILFCYLLSKETSNVKGQTVGDLTSDIFMVINGLVKEIPNLTPTIDQLFRLPIQGIVGVPEITFFQTVNQVCSIYLASGDIRPRITPNISEMAFLLGTPCQNESFPLLEAETILDSPNFDVTKKVVLYVSGWRAEDSSQEILSKAYNCRGGYNFLYLDAANFIDTFYIWSAYNTEEIGKYVAEGFVKLVEKVPLENIHLIGHSLGAQIVGYAGRYFTRFTGRLIPRITGLDPANPCFNEGETLFGIQRGDAEFIDIIHTNPGVLGKKHPVGDVDFYAGGLAPIKPGCFVVPCSHSRAFRYYAESVYPGNERNFLGVRCTSLTKVEDGFCDGEGYPMGYDVPFTLKGNYFLGVNKNTPYGKNATDKGILENSNCGACPY